jgi:ribonuclease P protein component
MVLFGIERDREEGSRLGVTVTRKIGCAAVRAKAKRRLRELFRQRFRGKERPFDLVINARKGCVSESWSQLEREFDRAVRTLRGRARELVQEERKVIDDVH